MQLPTTMPQEHKEEPPSTNSISVVAPTTPVVTMCEDFNLTLSRVHNMKYDPDGIIAVDSWGHLDLYQKLAELSHRVSKKKNPSRMIPLDQDPHESACTSPPTTPAYIGGAEHTTKIEGRPQLKCSITSRDRSTRATRKRLMTIHPSPRKQRNPSHPILPQILPQILSQLWKKGSRGIFQCLELQQEAEAHEEHKMIIGYT
jgi:hypothetical protein